MYVYVLKRLQKNRYYVGLTGDIDRRFLEHDKGWVKTTRFFKPFKLVHVEFAVDRNEARKLEKFFKSGYGREVIKEIGDIVAL